MTGPKPQILADLKEAELAGMTRQQATERTGYSRPTITKYARLFGLKFKLRRPKRQYDGLFRVYTHTLHGELIYIGAGRGRRPYDMRGRTDFWKATVAGHEREIEIGIIATFASKGDALDFEHRLIAGCAPTCCQKPGGGSDTTARDAAIRLKRSTGMTLQAIGDQYGLTRERVRQICEGEGFRFSKRHYAREYHHVKKSRQEQVAA